MSDFVMLFGLLGGYYSCTIFGM